MYTNQTTVVETELVPMGQIAYEAFLEHTKKYDSNPHPAWRELNADQQTSWDVAGYAVAKSVILKD
jgi:hypothetical protein